MISIDINRLRTFLKVAQYGSFKQVAAQEYLTQRAVSKQMTQLEAELNVPLFIRGNNKITLTAQGKVFLTSAQDIVNHYMSALTALQHYDQTQQRLRVGYFSAFEKHLLQDPLFQLRQQFPRLAVDIHESSNEHLTHNVSNGELDLALSIGYGTASLPDDSTLMAQSIYQGKMVIGVSTLNPLSQHTQLAPTDLRNRPMLYYSPESSTFLLNRFLATMPFIHDYEQIQRVTSTEQMHFLVALDQAYAFYPSGLLSQKQLQADQQINYLPIVDSHTQRYDIVALYDPKNKNPMLKPLLQAIKNEAASQN